MASLLQKIGLVISGNAHELVDAVIDMNNPAIVKQEIRRLEKARDTLRTQTAVATGQVSMTMKDIAGLEKQLGETQENIDLLLSDDDETNDPNALALQVQANGMSQQIEGKKGDLIVAEQTETTLKGVYDKVDARVKELVANMSRLTAKDRTAKAKEQAADALETAAEVANFDNTASVDNYARRIEERSATADARLNQAFASTAGGAEESVDIANAKATLAKRKAELKDKPAAAT